MSNNIVQYSIVIPAYNAGAFIAKTLDSVREQTLTDYEVLLTNDGSKDETEQVLADYVIRFPDFPLRLASQENRGIGGARNNGLFRASGEFIAFLDADDRWYPEKLERMAQFFSANPLVDVAYHDEIEIQRDGSRNPLVYGDVREAAYEDLLFHGNRLSTSATVVRRELAQRVGGFSDNLAYNGSEDYEFWLRLAKTGARFAHLTEVLGEYHRVEGSVTQKIGYHHRNIMNVLEHHFALLRNDGTHTAPFIDRMLRRKKAENLASMGRTFAGVGDIPEALRCLWQGCLIDPFCVMIYTKLLRTLWLRLKKV